MAIPKVLSDDESAKRKRSIQYREFKNYFKNELGITDAEIRAWSLEIIKKEVSEQLIKINARSVIDRAVSQAVTHKFFSNSKHRDEIIKAIADRFEINLSLKE